MNQKEIWDKVLTIWHTCKRVTSISTTFNFHREFMSVSLFNSRCDSKSFSGPLPSILNWWRTSSWSCSNWNAPGMIPSSDSHLIKIFLEIENLKQMKLTDDYVLYDTLVPLAAVIWDFQKCPLFRTHSAINGTPR